MKSVLFVVAFAMAAGCAAPSVGDEPSFSSSAPSAHDTSSDTSSDDDDDTSESTSETSSAEKAPSVAAVDAGAKAPVPCTDSGAVQFQGHCYFALTTAASWDDSQTACAATGAHLATLTSAAEEDIAEVLDRNDDRWIGLRRPTGSAAADASYVWVTSEPRSFSDWTQNEPNGSGSSGTNGSAECARMTSNGGWADEVCTVKHAALCERD